MQNLDDNEPENHSDGDYRYQESLEHNFFLDEDPSQT